MLERVGSRGPRKGEREEKGWREGRERTEEGKEEKGQREEKGGRREEKGRGKEGGKRERREYITHRVLRLSICIHGLMNNYHTSAANKA